MSRAEILEEFGIAGVRWEIDYEHLADRLADEIAALRTGMMVLNDALRKPSEAVLVAMGRADAFYGDVSDERLTAMLRAAVAAVEQEVGA